MESDVIGVMCEFIPYDSIMEGDVTGVSSALMTV